MRPALLLCAFTLGARASWFTPAQHLPTFDSWDESRLRHFLLEQGVVAPSGPKEQLVLLAKSHYAAYTDAATAAVAQATSYAAHSLDDSRDYVYSTWDDNKLRTYLQSKGVKVQDQAQKSRADLLGMMRDAYAQISNPVWEAWSDSYIHEWLVSHNIISPSPPKPYSRDFLLAKMGHYYYALNDTVYSSWSDSQLKDWLVQQGIVKSGAQIKRDKLMKLVQDNYLSATSTFWSAWPDNEIRAYLVEHGYIRSDAQVKRDELIKLANEKYSDTSARSAAYLTWPDARLRAYLRERGISEDKVPSERPGLLQETRIRYLQTQSRAEVLWGNVRDIVNGVGEGVEERLARVWNILRGGLEDGSSRAGQGFGYVGEKYESAKEQAGRGYARGTEEGERVYSEAEKKYESGKEQAYDRKEDAREKVGEKVKVAGEKIKGEL